MSIIPSDFDCVGAYFHRYIGDCVGAIGVMVNVTFGNGIRSWVEEGVQKKVSRLTSLEKYGSLIGRNGKNILQAFTF